MGTRGVTAVIQNGKPVIAQYGQWDHYPSGQGLDALKILKSFKGRWDVFKEKLKHCKFVTPAKQKEIDKFMKSIGSNDGWMTGEQAEKYHKAYPYLTRDHGAQILQLVMDSTDETIWLGNSIEFADSNQGFGCEGVFLVDLDKNTYEVHTSNPGQTPELDRFKVIGHTVTYKLNKLPSKKKFLEDCKAKEEEEA